MVERSYQTRVDFLPRSGNIFVDSSAIGWVCPIEEEEKDIDYYQAQLERVTAFNKLFKDRRRVYASDGILREISRHVSFFGKRQHRFNKSRGARRRNDIEYQNAVKNGKEYNRAQGLLSGRNICCSGELVPFYMASEFVDSLKGKRISRRNDDECGISHADAELVSFALSHGDGNGILAADYDMMDAYVVGVKKFGLKDSFVCNSVVCDLEFI